jgi:hypothetical protein
MIRGKKLAAVAAVIGAAMLTSGCGELSAQAVESGRWTPVSYAKETGKEMLIFVDKSSVRRAGSKVDLVTLAVRKQATEEGVDSVRERNLLDCDKRQAQSLGQDYLARGKRIHRGEAEPAMVAYAEGSSWRSLIDSVCTNDMAMDPTDDPMAVTQDFFAA